MRTWRAIEVGLFQAAAEIAAYVLGTIAVVVVIGVAVVLLMLLW